MITAPSTLWNVPELERARPPFEQIAGYYAAQIASGQLQPGDRIPSEREICAEWGVSKATSGKAIAKLKADGLVITTVGVGTAVAGPAAEQS